MNKNISVKSILIVIVVILSVGLASGSRAAAQESAVSGAVNPDQSIQVVDGGPGFVMISGVAFMPRNDLINYDRSASFLFSTDSVGTLFSAPVYIPDGATINQVVLYYYDSWTSSDLIVSLHEYNFSEYTYTRLTQLFSSGDTGHGIAIQNLAAEVSNNNNAYILEASFPAGANQNIQLAGVRIDYGYSTYLSLINK